MIYIPFSTKTPSIFMMSAFSQKISVFGKNSAFTQNNSTRAELFSYCKIKYYYQ